MGPMTDELTRAITAALSAHHGQVYRGYGGRPDEPYILHPLRVMLAVSPRSRVVAVLHDVTEDTGLTPGWLTSTQATALWLLTRDKEHQTYAQYIDRLLNALDEAGEIAREVKRADLDDNMAHDPPDRLRERYTMALVRLAPTTEEMRRCEA